MAECTGTAAPARPSTARLVRLERPQRLEARVDVVVGMIVRALVERVAADDAEAGAVGAVDRRDRLGEEDRVANGRLEVQLVVVREADDILVVAVGQLDRRTRVEVDRGQDLLLDLDLDRLLHVAEAADALQGQLRREIGGDDQAPVCPSEVDAAVDGCREAEIVAEVDRDALDRVVANGAGGLAQQPAYVPDERLIGGHRAPRARSGHRRTGCGSSSSSSMPSSTAWS